MEIKKGIPVSPGVSIGEILVLGQEDFRIRRRRITRSRIGAEVQRLDRALEKTIEELNDEISRLGVSDSPGDNQTRSARPCRTN